MFIPFYESDVEKERFYKLPKAFVLEDKYRLNLDSNAKMVYAILWDRYQLSISNNWKDKHGIVYCIYSRENLANDMNVSVSTITKCIKKLTELDLMKEIRRGLNKPNLMYIGQVESGISKYTIQEHEDIRKSDTDLRETEKIKRHAITSDDGFVFGYYLQRYKETFYKEHPTVTEEQMNRMQLNVENMQNEHNVDNQRWKLMIDEHFENMSSSNDGNVLYFMSGDYQSGILRRYKNWTG